MNENTPLLSFPKTIKNRIEFYEKASEQAARKRNRMAFTLWQRYNEDYYGIMDPLLDTYIPVPDDGLMKYPILGPAVRANDANWLATRIKPEIEGASSSPDVMAGVNVCQAAAAYFSRRDWNEGLEQLQSHYCQLSYTYLLRSGNARTRTAETIKVPRFKDVETPGDPPQYACANCGASGDASPMIDGQASDNERGGFDYDTPLPCPECNEARAYAAPGANPDPETERVLDGYDEVPGGDNWTKIYPGFCYLIDEEHAKSGDTQNAHWVAVYELVRRYEVEAQSPHLLDKDEDEFTRLRPNDGKDWIDGLKWWHALERGVTELDIHQNRRDSQQDDLLQRSRWWMQPQMWKGWRAPADYTHTASGFEIRQGETMEEAFARPSEKYPQGRKFIGLYLRLCGERLEWIDTRDHRDELTAGIWLPNGSNFHGKPQLELLDFQTAANEWFTMFFQHGLHSSMPHRILDVNMFDKADFANDAGGHSYTRKGVGRGRPLSDYVLDLPPGSMSSDMFPIFEVVIKEGAQDTAGIANPSVGKSDPAQKTFGGQQLLTQRSLGLMIPSQKSKKRAYVQWLYHQLINLQKYASDERIHALLNDTDKSWDDSDINSFRALNIRRDVVIDAPDGSDIPVTFTDREQKLMAVIQSGILWSPDVPDEIKEQVVRYAGIDYDPNNYRRDREYILRVMQKIERGCEWADKNGKAWMIAAGEIAVQLGVPEGTPVINPLAVQQILTLPGVEIMPRSTNIPLAIKMITSRVTALASVEEPDAFKLKVLQQRLDDLTTQGVTNTTDAAAIAGHVNSLAQGGDPNAAQGGTGGEDPAAKMEMEKMRLQSQSQEKEKDRELKEHLQLKKEETQKELLHLKHQHEKETTRQQPAGRNTA